MQGLLLAIDRASTLIGKVFAWCIVLLTLQVNYEVTVRYAFARPTSWGYDASYMLYGTLFMMAGAYTLLNHDPLDDLFPFCLDHGLSVVVASPFNTGILATGSADSSYDYGPPPAEVSQRVRSLVAACADHGRPARAPPPPPSAGAPTLSGAPTRARGPCPHYCSCARPARPPRRHRWSDSTAAS